MKAAPAPSEPEPAESLTVIAGGLRLAGERWPAVGEERGVLILLPGGGQTRHSWDRAASRLREGGWTAVTMDLRGHGESEWDESGDYSIATQAEDLIETIAAVAPDPAAPPVLVGASMGGMAALLAAGRHPGCCSGLVLVDIALRIEPEGRERIRAFMTERPEGFGSLEEAAGAVAAYRRSRRSANHETLAKNLRRGEDGRWRWHWDPRILEQDHDSEDPSHPMRAALREAAAAIEVPVLLVRGLLSDVVSDEGLEEAKRLLPRASVAEVSQAGHMIVGDDNATFLAAIGRFLAELEPGAAPLERG